MEVDTGLTITLPSVRTLDAACLECGSTFRRNPCHANEHRFCRPSCRAKWHREHKTARQTRLDFTPAASELAHALRGRETKAQRIVARLRLGPATTWELAKAGGMRFSARLGELKAKGLRYEREDHADHSVYTMTREPGA